MRSTTSMVYIIVLHILRVILLIVVKLSRNLITVYARSTILSHTHRFTHIILMIVYRGKLELASCPRESSTRGFAKFYAPQNLRLGAELLMVTQGNWK